MDIDVAFMPKAENKVHAKPGGKAEGGNGWRKVYKYQMTKHLKE